MLAAIVERQIAAAEREAGESADWLRELYRGSSAAYFKFALFLPLSRHVKRVSLDGHAVARLIGALSEDCGSCVQITVNMMIKAGADPTVLKAVLDGRPQDLAAPLDQVYAYAMAVVGHAPDANERAERLKATLGEAEVAELALGIATARLFPTVKRGMGDAVSCAQVVIDVPGAERARVPQGSSAHVA